MNSVEETFNAALGLGLSGPQLHFGQMVLRAFIVFFATLAMIRIAGRRFLAGRNSFDMVMGFIMASMLSRAINGTTAFWGTLGIGFFLASLYRFFTFLACKSHAFGKILKGEPKKLIINGEVDLKAMSRHNISRHDLQEDLRLNGATNDTAEVKAASLERNGQISVQRRPKIFDIAVEKNVQTVRIQIE
jgi:uncharacterized membrane protein YcaP (DUF421 family)